MTIHKAEVLHISMTATPQRVYAFLSDQREDMSADQFRADREAVEADLARMRRAIEAGS